MRRLTGILLAATLLVGACQGSPLTASGKKATTKNGAGTRASAAPSTAPSGAGLASSAPKPAVPLSDIAGSLRMDASYVVAAGGGNVVAAGGGNVIAAGGGNLISVGGQVIAAGGGNVIAPGGGNVIAPGGGNVIAPGGGNVIAPGGGNYRIAADGPAFGSLLPAKGMVVVPVSLKTGKILGDAVFTDEKGGFTVQVPKSETGNVRLVAAVPSEKEADARSQDHRLSLELMVALGVEKAASIDDDTSLVSRYARETFAGRMLDLLKTRDQKSWGVEVEQWAQLGGGNELIKGMLDELYLAISEAHCADLPPDEQRKLAEAMSDVVMAYVDLDKAMVDKSQPSWKPAKDEKVFDAMIEMIKACREGATVKMAGDRAYFAKVTYLSTLMGEKPAEFIKRPADFCDFLVTNYLTVNDSDRLGQLRPIFTDLGCNPAWADRLKAAEFGMLSQVGMTMFLNPQAKEAMFALVRASKK